MFGKPFNVTSSIRKYQSLERGDGKKVQAYAVVSHKLAPGSREQRKSKVVPYLWMGSPVVGSRYRCVLLSLCLKLSILFRLPALESND